MTTKQTVLEPARKFMGNPRYVTINFEQAARFAGMITDFAVPELGAWDFREPLKGRYFSFFVNSINFCFWAKKGALKWGIEQDGQQITGYNAFVRACRRAFESNNKLWEPDYLAEIGFEEFQGIFQGSGELLLLPERHEIICENFEILCSYYVGEIERLANCGAGDVNLFIQNLTRDFPSFRDEMQGRGEKLYFLKRVQLLAVEFFKSGILFNNLSDLSVFSDYKIPQLLEAEGILAYSEELRNKIALEDLILEGSEEECEIRAATVIACEMIREELKKLGRDISSVDLDFILWVSAKNREFKLPHHKTLTINY